MMSADAMPRRPPYFYVPSMILTAAIAGATRDLDDVCASLLL